ncbi:MAG: SHOCT domain-containing protein [Actinomycetia bacterium]|nr:SHOCT domain-containing protein [Actinomycetes bacterium]
MSDDFGLGEVIVSMFWFMLLIAWIWLLISILGDIFSDHELSGVAKALWTLFLIVLPWAGALVYLVVRGRSMNDRARRRSERAESDFRAYVQDAAGGGTAAELGRLADLRDRGAISTDDYLTAKAKVLT